MKRLLFLFSLFLFTLSFMPTAAQAALAPDEITGEVVYIPFPVAITLDGALDDWAGVPVITVDRGSIPSPDPTQNADFRFQVAADADNFYITMQTDDANIVTGQHGTDFWNEDSFEFYLNLSGDRYATAYGDGIFQININPGDLGNTDPTAITVTGTNGASSGAQASVFATATGWGIEAAVPLSGYITPEHGAEIGFQAQMNGATELDRSVKLIWSAADTNDNSWNNPSLFGSGLFFEVGRTDIPMASERPEPVAAVPERYISLNQLGYFASAPKYAMFAGQGTNGTVWTLINADTGERVTAGFTTPGNLDPASGDYVQMVDFSSITAPGNYLLTIDTISSEPFRIADDLYTQLPIDAARYFYLNRSGIELDAEHAGEQARPAGHVTDDAVTCWRGTDPQGVQWEGCDYLLNGRGGWYDAGDYGKYVVNGGISLWTLLNLYERQPDAFPDGSLNIPESGNGVSDLLDEARWEMEFLMAMQVPEGQALAGMVHHKLHDAQWSGVPVMPPTEYDNNSTFANPSGGRYLFPPSTAATLNVAATAAQCARIWREIDADFAARCLSVAETAWRAANDNPIMLAGNVPGAGGGNYDDNNVDDEFYWAAAELFITTGNPAYKDFFTASPFYSAFPNMNGGSASSMSWGSVAALGTISLATVANDLSADEIAALRAQIAAAADHYLNVIAGEGYRVSLTQNQYFWGSSSDVLNNALVMALAYDFTGEARYLNGVTESMDYLLGRNALSFSFISGYGARSMQHPHHRFWGNQGDFPPPPPGAVAGGPNGNPSDPAALDAGVNDLGAAKRYVDLIGSWSTNEVTINWNAPLVWVSAYLDAQMRANHAD
jgi:endoglucanase